MSATSPIWHPFTQHAIFPEMTKIASANGAYLTKSDGTKVLDAIASWWVVTHGHCEPRIAAAVKEQSEKLDQIIFAGFTHEPAEDLAERLLDLAPKGYSHVFFSDSGSTAVEVAIKMALGYWAHVGEKRTRIIAMEHGYHGDTIGTMSAGARGVFNEPYEPVLFDVERMPFPEGDGEAALSELRRLANLPDAAALLVEPLVLGAGGMLMYSPDILRQMHEICSNAGILFLADEVMTGWGRTGSRFACDQADFTPDILCTSKGLTGGALPLSATLATRPIYDAHYSEDRRKTFFHSSSFTANPLACAAAAANLAIWQEGHVEAQVANLANLQSSFLERFRNDSRFSGVRQTGTIAAVDFRVKDGGYLAGLGPQLQKFFLKRGVLLRPLGNTVYCLPPYCVTQGDLEQVYDAISAAADEFF